MRRGELEHAEAGRDGSRCCGGGGGCRNAATEAGWRIRWFDDEDVLENLGRVSATEAPVGPYQSSGLARIGDSVPSVEVLFAVFHD